MADTWGENDKPVGKVAAADDWGQNDKPAAPAETWGGDDAPPARGLKGWGQDVAATAVKAAISVPEAAVGVADLVTGGKAGKALEDVGVRFKEAREIAEDWHSDATKHAKREFADADGIVDKAKVAVTNPALVGLTIGESLGLMGGGGVVGRGVMAAAPKLAPIAATAIGEGVAGAGSAAESIRQETDNGELSAKQAALAAGSGVATGVLGAVGGAAARKLGVGDADVMLTQGWKGLFKQHADDAAAAAAAGTAPAVKSLPRQVIEGAISEGLLEELPQSVSEQVLQNLALDKPWNEGVDEAIVMGTLSGMAMGGGASGIKAFTEPGAPAGKDQSAPAQTDPATPAPAPVQPGPAATGPATPAPTPEQPSPAAAAPTPAEQLGIKAEAGTLSSAAAKAVNEGISPVQPSLASTAAQAPVTDGPKDTFGNPTDDARRVGPDDATRMQLDAAVREAQAAGDAEAIAAATRARRMWDAQAKPTAQLAQEYHELSAAQDVPYKPQVMQAILDELGSRGFTLDRVIDRDTGEIQGYRAKPLLPKTEARPVQPGVYATYEEAAAARAEQAARGSTVKAIPSPVEGGFILAIKGTPEYERGLKLANERWAEQQRQRDKRKKEEQRAKAQQQKQAKKAEKTPQAQTALELEQAPAAGLPVDGAPAVSAAAASAAQSAPASGAQADAGVAGAGPAGAGDAVTAGQATAQQIAREGNEVRRQRMVQASVAWASMKPVQRQAVVKAAKGVNLTKKGQLHTQAWADMSDKQRQALAKAMDSMPTQQPTAVAQASEQAELATQSAGAPAAAESPVLPQSEQTVAAAAPTQDAVTSQQEGVAADSQASASAADALPQPSEAAPAPEPAKASKPKPAAKSPDLSAYDKVAQEYGMRVKEDGTIVLANGKDSSIRVALKGGRMRAEGKDGSLQFSGVGPAALGKFVEKFWFATKVKPAAPKTVPERMREAAAEEAKYENAPAENPVDAAAAEAAPNPTEAQREAGNYQMGHMAIDGLEISIETQAGTSRRPEWPPLANHYGYFKGTVGKDKDHVDVFLLPEASDTSRPVVVIDQNHANGQFDEHKVVLGAADAEEAVKAYHANYSKDWKGYGGHAVMSWEEFKAWVTNPALTKQRAAPQGKAAAATDDRLTPEAARTKTATAPAAEKKAEAAQAPASLLDRHNAIARGLNDGTLQLEEYKAAFAELEANEEQVRAELNKLTKDALLRSGGYVFRMRYASEKKEVIVSAALEEMRRTYALGRTYGPTSYMMTAGGIAKHKQLQAEALRELVANTTAEDLAKRAAEVQAARDEYKAQVNAHKEALANPQSLQDFRKFMQHWREQGDTSEAAYLRLTPEQRRQFDELEAESTRERREAAKRAAKTAVATAGNTSANEVIATKHTKHGHDLFVVKLADRVERDAYLTLNASAKRLGGSYSSYRGNGAIPGFQFRTREAAEAFRKLVSGDTKAASELAEKRRDAFDDDKSQTASERLSTMAEALEAQADAALSMDRKTNTARRARFAASAESAARYSKALAGTMRNIAKAIDAGTAKFVDGVRQKVQVEFLMTALRRAKEKQLEAKYPSYADRVNRTGEPIDAETVDFAEWPQYVMFRSDLASLARQLQEVEGGKKLGAVLGKLADDVTEAYTDWAKANLLTVSKFGRGDSLADFSSREDAERAIRRSNLVGKAIVLPIKRGQNRVVLAPSEAMKLGLWQGDGDKRIQLTDDFVQALVKLGKRKGSKAVSVPWQIEGAYEKRTRLQRMGIQTPAEFRSALREFANLQEAIAAPDRIKEMERAMVGRRNDGLDFFPTSPAVVNAMLEAAEIQEGMSVLEPSAGMGHIADAIVAETGVWPDVVELSGDRRDLLLAKGYYLTEYNDFLQMEPRKFFSYGDTFRAPDGTEGIMRGVGGMGSQRVRLEDKDGNRLGLYDRSDLVGIAQNGTWSGYDRIVMNPPFSDGRDIAHVQHAYNLLKPGGRIVAIMGESAFFNSNKKAQAFREWLEERGATNEKLPEGSFMDPSLPVNTGVSARMVVIDKPAGDLQLAQESSVEEAAYAGARRTGKSGTPSDRAVMDMVREGATTAQVLEFISATSRSAFNRKLAKVLLKTGISPKLTMGAPLGGADGFTFLAKYNRPTDTVTMTEGATHMAEQIMLHELVHAATLKALDSKGLASMQMRRLYEHVKKQGGGAGQYGMKNVREFVAEAFTNPEFQRALKGMSAPPQSTLRSAWDSLIRVLKRILGLPANSTNALSAAMTLGVEVMRENVVLARSARGVPANGSQDSHYGQRQQPVSYTEARALLSGVAAQLPLAKDFILLNSARQLGVPLPPDTPKGALIDGRVYLFADAHSDGLDFVQTIFHEMLHAGVARAVPADQRAALFSQLLNGSEVVRDKARAWAASATGMHQRDELRKQGLTGRALGNAWGNLAIEEALAEVSEDLAAHNLVGTKRGKTVSALAKWLASVAQAMNLQQLADRIRAFTHTEAEAFVVRMLSVDGTLPVLEQPDNLTRNRTARPELSVKTLREVSGAAKEYVNELMSTAPGGISWWHKTIGTQHNLAENHKEYRPVFNAAQQFIDDVSSLANEVSDLAPRLLPKLDTLRDLKFWGKNAKKPVSAVDNKAIAKPLFEGTLLWTRDFEGKPILVADLETMTASWTLEQKAQQLVATREYGPNVIRMWQSLPQSQYEAIITSVFKKRLLQPGIRWTDAELREMFQLNDAQLGLFREARSTIDASLDKTARAEILRLLGSEYADLRDVVMDAPDLETAMDVVTSMLHEMALQDDTGAERLLSLHDEVVRAATRARDLIAKGYAPLQRFGEHTVDVVDKDGNRLYFGLFESKGEAADMAKQMQELYAEEGATVTRGKLSKLEHKLFAGVNPESLELFGDMLGLGMDGNEAKDLAFQEFIRKTKNNHSALKRLIHRKGIAGYSEDVGRVLASFVYSNARQGAGALNAGTMERAIQAIPKGKGELKDAAMALREYISNPQEEGQLVRGFLFAQYLGGSIASALVNMTQPAAVTFPWLTQFTSARNAAAQLSRAMADMATRGKKYEPDLAKALQAAEDDGTVSPQEIHQLMAQARGEASLRAGDGTAVGEAKAAANNFWRRTVVAWGQPFAWAEQFNRRSTFIAAYRIARANGHDNPAEFARLAVQESQFMYSKANKMRFARGAIGGTLMTFKTYSVSYLELLHRMWTQGGPEGKRATVLALGMLMLMGGAGGLPFVEDVEDVVNALAAKMGYSFNTKQARKEFLTSLVGAWGADFIENGVSGLPGAPIDVSGRLGMGNLIPGTGLMGPNEDKSRDMLEMVGPAGDFVQRVFAGAGMALGGNLAGAAMEVSPTAVRNVAKGVEMGVTGLYTNKDGYKILDTTLPEAIAKGIGFQPKSVADVQETNVFMARARSFYTQTSAEIRAQWARGIAEGDQSAIDAARERMLDWNRKNPEQPIRIRVPDLHKRAREMRKDRTQRLADTAPKALRENLRNMAIQESR